MIVKSAVRLVPANGSVRSVHLLGWFMFDSAVIPLSTSVFLVGSSSVLLSHSHPNAVATHQHNVFPQFHPPVDWTNTIAGVFRHELRVETQTDNSRKKMNRVQIYTLAPFWPASFALSILLVWKFEGFRLVRAFVVANLDVNYGAGEWGRGVMGLSKRFGLPQSRKWVRRQWRDQLLCFSSLIGYLYIYKVLLNMPRVPDVVYKSLVIFMFVIKPHINGGIL